MSQQDLEQSATQNKLSTMEQLDIKVEPETHNDDTPHVHNMQQTDTFLSCDKKLKNESMLHHEVFIKDDPDSDNKCSELIDDTQVIDGPVAWSMPQQDLEQSATQNKLSTMQQLDIKVEPETHNDDTPHVHNMQQTDSFLICDKKIKYETVLHHELIIKDDPDSDNKCSELIDDTQVMCTQTANGLSILPVPLKVEVEDSVDRLEVSSLESVDEQQVKPSGTDNVCASGNSSQCDVCHKWFSNKNYLKVHIRAHSEVKPFKCNICSKTFSFSGSFRVHSRTHTGKKPHRCDICGRNFSQLNTLNVHIRTHTGEKPYKCNVCEKSFSQFSSLKYHKRKHNGEKPHKCKICDKSFAQPSNLSCHMRTHTGEKPFKCIMCDKSFTLLSHLQDHIRSHTGEKPYKCDMCGKSFRDVSNLHSHTRGHTGEKPYKCKLCDRSFGHPSVMRTHILTHTGEKPYKCDICDKSFGNSGTLYNHINRHTGKKPKKR